MSQWQLRDTSPRREQRCPVAQTSYDACAPWQFPASTVPLLSSIYFFWNQLHFRERVRVVVGLERYLLHTKHKKRELLSAGQEQAEVSVEQGSFWTSLLLRN